MKEGDIVTILDPVKPQETGTALLSKVSDFGELIYEVEQFGSKQWYKKDKIRPFKEDPNVEAWSEYEKQNKLCDQYKEAISEATEDTLDSIQKTKQFLSSVSHASKLGTPFQSGGVSSTGAPFIGGSIIGEPVIRPQEIFGRPFKTCAEIYGNTYMTKEEKQTTKKALALLAEQKQNELKEIEELIKKL